MALTDIAKTFTKKELPDSEVELSGEIPAAELTVYSTRALASITEDVEMPGFRKGHVPEAMVRQRVGEVALLEEAVELYMRDLYPVLLDEHKVDAVGRPDVKITKLAPGNPVGITVVAAVYPLVTLPKDWQEIAGKVAVDTVPDVLDSEIDEALEQIRKARAAKDETQAVDASTETATDSATETTEKKTALPALDDAFAQSLGQFADLSDLKTKLRENMQQEKVQKAKDTRRGKIVDALLEQTDVAVPRVFVESELEKIIEQMKEDIARFGLSFDEYLKQVKKTDDEIRDDFREQARKRAKLQLALNKLAVEQKVEADTAQVDEELKHALEHFPDARPELVRVHIETVLRNERVLKLLEGEDISTPASAKPDAHEGHDHSDHEGHSHE